jgi:large subunit ribosomal protein L22
MDIEAKLKYAKISPKKMRDVARILRGKAASEALALVRCVPRKSARLLGDLLSSAIANAENNNNLAAGELVIDTVVVEDGPVLKRFMPVGRGSAHPIRKRMSHVRLVLKQIGKREG